MALKKSCASVRDTGTSQYGLYFAGQLHADAGQDLLCLQSSKQDQFE